MIGPIYPHFIGLDSSSSFQSLTLDMSILCFPLVRDLTIPRHPEKGTPPLYLGSFQPISDGHLLARPHLSIPFSVSFANDCLPARLLARISADRCANSEHQWLFCFVMLLLLFIRLYSHVGICFGSAGEVNLCQLGFSQQDIFTLFRLPAARSQGLFLEKN